MYLFLQNLRATLIPTIAVPVVLLGTFGVLAALGFSINMLTMFAMVLAIGLLVDDAIVVVENVERVMSEEGLSPVEATRKSMDQITGALVGIGLVLVGGVRADGVPRRLDRRHLPPVLGDDRVGHGAVGAGRDRADAGAVRHDAEAAREGRARAERGFFGWFNRRFERSNERYQGVRRAHAGARAGASCSSSPCSRSLMALLFAAAADRLPARTRTRASLFAQVQAPVGATQERTHAVIEQVEQHFLENEKRRRRLGVHRAGLQLRAAAARTPAWRSSS